LLEISVSSFVAEQGIVGIPVYRGEIAELGRRLEDNEEVIGTLARAAKKLSDQIVGVHQGLVGVQQTQVEMQQDIHRGRVEMNGRIDSVTTAFNDFVKTSATNTFVGGLRGTYLPYLHHGFHGPSGNNFFCPVEIEDHKGAQRALCVISLPCAGTFYLKECGLQLSVATTNSFFLSPFFVRAEGLNYKDVIEALLLTGFGFLAVGPQWNQMRVRNTERFVIVEAAFMKKLLGDIDAHIPNRPRNRSDFVHGDGRTPNYKVDGVDYGFRQESTEDKSTGRIVQIGRSIPLERKILMPVMGEAWVAEWYTKAVAEFFEIPEDMRGVRHVVSSVVDPESALVKKHAEAIREYRKRKSRSSSRKSTRAEAKKAKSS